VKPPQQWRVVIESYPCPRCGAGPGKACRTAKGATTYIPHAARERVIDRCPLCGARIPAGALPGDLCERCALVRSLEVERATHYRRREP